MLTGRRKIAVCPLRPSPVIAVRPEVACGLLGMGPLWSQPIMHEPVLLAVAAWARGQVGAMRAGIFPPSRENRGPGSHRKGRSGAVVIRILCLIGEAGLHKEAV